MERIVPIKYRKGYERALAGKGSPRKAIQQQCLECVQYVRAEVTLCTDKGCPLYAFRPYAKDEVTPDDLEQLPESCELVRSSV